MGKKEALAAQKSQLLGKLTEQMKTIMAKLNDKDLSEVKREAMRALLLQVKGKMDALNKASDMPPTAGSMVASNIKQETEEAIASGVATDKQVVEETTTVPASATADAVPSGPDDAKAKA